MWFDTLMSQLIVRPKPNEAYFELPIREATKVAWELAKRYSTTGKPDWSLFKEFTGEWNRRYRERNAKT